MTVANTTVEQSWNGNDLTTDFTIPCYFVDGEESDIIKVYLDGVLQVEAVDFNFTGGPPVTTVAMVVAPATGEVLKVKRETPLTQETDFSGTVFPAESVETKCDKLLTQIQEVENDVSNQISLNEGTSLSELELPIEEENKFLQWNDDKTELQNVTAPAKWVTGTNYNIDDIVWNGTAIYKCLVDHLSAATFDSDLAANRWTGMSGAKGDTGATGPTGMTGLTGAVGPQGPAGANGAAGADGVFSDIASQGEAQTGVDNTKGMTPLRTKEAIDFQVPVAQITTNQTNITTNTNAISALDARVTTLESNSEITRATGSQRITNNQAVPEDLVGGDVTGGAGNRLELSAVGALSANIYLEMQRIDDGEVRFSTAIYVLHYINGTWYLAERETIRVTGNPIGVTLAVTQAAGVAQVNFISDNMAGGNYDTTNSLIKWNLREIAKLS